MPQPTQPSSLSNSPSSPFFVPVAFHVDGPLARHGMQEPQSATDTPTGAGPQPGSVGGPQGTEPKPVPGGPCAGDNNMFLFLGLGLALMYFMVMRPEQKRRKEQQAILAAIKVGDKVVTLGGMHGVVAALADTTLTLRVDTVKVTIDRTAVARVDRNDAVADAKSS